MERQTADEIKFLRQSAQDFIEEPSRWPPAVAWCKFLRQSAQDFIEDLTVMVSSPVACLKFLRQSAQDFIEERRSVASIRCHCKIPEAISSGLH